jgi:hypothetical protein
MTSSRSSILRSSLVVFAALVFWMGHAEAQRKRLVVLDFEGPKAEKFHADVVKLIKKSHTVLTVTKWNDQADDMGATAVTNKNITKVAKKLKIDGVVTGKIEKRRDEYIIRLKLRSGSNGGIVVSANTKSESARLDAQSQRDLKDELIAAIDELESNRGGGGGDDDEEDEPAPKKKKKAARDDDEDEEEQPKKSGFGKKGQMAAEEDPKALAKKKKAEQEEAKRLAKEEQARKKEEERKRKEDERARKEDEKRKKDDDKKRKAEEAAFAKARAKKAVDEDDDDADPADEEDERPKKKTKKKRTAARDEDEDEDSIEEDADVDVAGSRDLSVAGRAVDAVIGMSFTRRQLRFDYAMDLAKPPPGYRQTVPVAGAIIDITLYPLAFGKTQGPLRGIGFGVLYDQVLVISSQKKYSDEQGNQRIATLETKESRWAAGPVFRYPLGKLVVGGSLTYGKQEFTVAQTLPNNQPTDIPNVTYTMITPAAFVKFPVTSKIVLNADAAFHGITDTGAIQQSGMAGYGAATVTSYGVEGGADYMVTKNIFARASVRFQSISFKFKGDPTSQTNLRDSDPEQDVMGAKDTYFGGMVTAGYVY